MSLNKVPRIVLFGIFFAVTVLQFDRLDRRALSWSCAATLLLGLLVEARSSSQRSW